jgi:hypothetical protein
MDRSTRDMDQGADRINFDDPAPGPCLKVARANRFCTTYRP